mmetsp:Transcript_62190/g.166500  ORF Transcript_62190/g.166500 Transcript_62190/m.166500 type:complete len:240 (-) Transcript_62190:482-1201(-)
MLVLAHLVQLPMKLRSIRCPGLIGMLQLLNEHLLHLIGFATHLLHGFAIHLLQVFAHLVKLVLMLRSIWCPGLGGVLYLLDELLLHLIGFAIHLLQVFAHLVKLVLMLRSIWCPGLGGVLYLLDELLLHLIGFAIHLLQVFAHLVKLVLMPRSIWCPGLGGVLYLLGELLGCAGIFGELGHLLLHCRLDAVQQHFAFGPGTIVPGTDLHSEQQKRRHRQVPAADVIAIAQQISSNIANP